MRFEKDSIEDLKAEFKPREGSKVVSCRDVRNARYLRYLKLCSESFSTSRLLLRVSECNNNANWNNNHIPEYGC